MVTQISLGNFYQSGGKTVVGGSASGIDTEGLIKGLTEAKAIPATKLKDKIDVNTKTATSLKSFQDLLTKFQDASNFLRNPLGVNNASTNVFEFRKASIASNDSAAGSSYMTVTAEPGSPVGTYDLKIDALATRNIKTTSTFALANANTSVVGGGGPFNAGTLTLGASATAVTLNAGDTLTQVAAKINAVSSQSKVQASVVQIATGQYRLSFKTTETGAALNYDILTPNAAVLNVGFSQQSDAVDAQLQLDGTTITRSQNSIGDLVDGVTFNLLRTTPAATDVTVDIGADHDLVKQGITNFVDSYNNLKLFVSQQTALGTDGKPTKDALLANNPTVTQAMSSINVEMSHAVTALSATDPAQMADIGITYTDYPADDKYPFTRNILSVDDDKLTSAIATNFDAVSRIFEFDYTSTDANMAVFSHTQDTGVENFTVHIDSTNVDPALRFYATYTDPTTLTTQTAQLTAKVNGAGYTFTGQKGTPFDGLKLLYATTPSVATSIDMSINQGMGDRIYNSLNNMIDPKTGTVQLALNNLTEQSTRYQTNIDKINTSVETYRQQLLNQFAALEKAISSANTLLQSLDANSKAQQANN